MNLKLILKRYQTFFVLVWLVFLIFVLFRKTFGLSLYGDDWLVISKYFGNYGPGRQFNYIDKSLLLTNYGPQYVGMAIIYKLFGLYSLPYYVVNLILRALNALGIYIFAKKLSSKSVALVAATFFAISSIGVGTTDWVYNMNSYVGIFFAMIGLAYFVERKNTKESLFSWFMTILGYMVVIIRLYILPFTLFCLSLGKSFTNSGRSTVKKILLSLVRALAVFVPFLAIKQFFPGLGFQDINSQLISTGINKVSEMLSQGKVDWIFTPFTSLGMMLFPEGFPVLGRLNFVVYPTTKFISFGLLLIFLGLAFIIAVNKVKRRWIALCLLFSPLLCATILKLVAHFQKDSMLNNITYFAWTFTGLILFTIVAFIILDNILQKKWSKSGFYIVGLTFSLAFLFPWLYSPGSILETVHRYNIIPSVGISLILGGLFGESIQKLRFAWKHSISTAFLLIFAVVQIFAVSHFFSMQLSIRPRELNEKIYSQLMAELPDFPHDRESIFYFEVERPEVFGELIGFGFPYHMQLLYNLEQDGQKYPFSVGTKKDLIKTITDINETRRMGYTVPQTPTPIDHVFAFKLDGDKLTNITPQIREELTNLKNEE